MMWMLENASLEILLEECLEARKSENDSNYSGWVILKWEKTKI